MDRFIVFETVFRVIGDVDLKSNMDRFIERIYDAWRND